MKDAKDVDPNGDKMRLPNSIEMLDNVDMTAEQAALYDDLRSEAKLSSNPNNIKEGNARPLFAVIRDMDRVTADLDMYHGITTFIFKKDDKDKVRKMVDSLPSSITEKGIDEYGEKYNFEVAKESEIIEEKEAVIYKAINGFEKAVMSSLKKFGIDYVNHILSPKYAKMIVNMQKELDSNGQNIIKNHLPVNIEQVGIINAETAEGEKLQQIADKYNRGDFRIIVANKKAEVGVNLQKGTSAIHHLTLPWNPASLQQRNGRGVRQGNKRENVSVYYYQAKGSFDEFRLDLLKNKGNWIANLMDKNSDNDKAENSEAMGAIDQAALLSDNKEEFLKKINQQKADKAKKEKEEKKKV